MKPTTKRQKSLRLNHKQAADEKRLQSIAAKKKEYANHQNAIRAALANVDTTSNKKIIFDPEDPKKDDFNSTTKMKNGELSGKQCLFDGSDNDGSEIEYNFDVKEQFQGRKGKKLLELQSKYKNDKRFELDERFLEDENDRSDSDKAIEDKDNIDENGISENELVEEKHAELAILEEVLGRKLGKKNEEVKRTTTKSMLRYDPSKSEHANFEVKTTETSKAISKKRKRKESEKERAVLPEVSKETFYEVKQNLKDSLQESHSFSLLRMFGKHKESEKEMQQAQSKSSDVIDKNPMVKTKNPFKYDSSDNESDAEDQNKTERFGENKDLDEQRNVCLGPKKLWREPFFFQEDDYRFQEGFDFVRLRFETEDMEFSKVRRDVKEIVKGKVRHNQKKNRPFKKKLGGHKKIIKMKKAMRR